MIVCPAASPGFVGGTLSTIDCQVQRIADEGVRALGLSGQVFGPALVALLTLAIALIGYRMLLGETPTLRQGVVTAIKIGAVLMLTTSWPAFRTLIADVALSGPAELAAAIGEPAGLPAAAGGLSRQLDGVAAGLEQVAETLATTPAAGTGSPPARPASVASPTQARPATAPQAQPPATTIESPAAASIRQARTIFLVAAVGGLAAVHLVAGLMLAVAPLFLAFLLFDATRGLVAGWLRVLGAGVLAGAGIALTLALQVDLMAPRIATATRLATDAAPVDTVAIQLLALVWLFAGLQLAVLVASILAMAELRLPGSWGIAAATAAAPTVIAGRVGAGSPGAEAMPAPPSRARALADSVAAQQRREAALVGVAGVSGAAGQGRAASVRIEMMTASGAFSAASPGAARHAGRRVSGSAERRDRRP